jgi:formylglycine-generating enzyme required for sulfatase activity
LSGGRHPAGRLALIALALGLSGLAAAHELRTPTESVMANPAPSSAAGPTFASSSEGGSVKLWNVADAISAAGASSFLPSAAPPAPGRLVALVIANGAYPDAPLQNPVVDAGLVGESLKRIGFAVTVKTNVDLDGFEQALSDFAAASKGADVALFYFAGHGFSVAADGIQQNLLMTTSSNFQAKSEIALRQGGEPLDHVEETVIGRARATLIFIDACRNVPVLAHRGIGSRGFAPIDPSSAEGAYVVLSTRQGKTAEDGEAGQGSPFARAVAATLPTAGLRIEDAAARIRKKVREETSDAQDPDVVRSDLPEGGVVLMGGRSPPPAVASLEAPPPADSPSAVPQTPAPVPAAEPPAAAVSVGPPPKIAANDAGGEVFKECDECPEMVVVPAGKSMLGSPPGESGRQTFESAPHLVEIAKPFAVGRYAVTFAQWDACYAEGACGHRRLGDLDFGRGKRNREHDRPRESLVNQCSFLHAAPRHSLCLASCLQVSFRGPGPSRRGTRSSLIPHRRSHNRARPRAALTVRRPMSRRASRAPSNRRKERARHSRRRRTEPGSSSPGSIAARCRAYCRARTDSPVRCRQARSSAEDRPSGCRRRSAVNHRRRARA